MIHDIRHAFNELLHENHWMDKETRLVAEDKANNIREQIGYPEYITNTTRLVDEYKNVSNLKKVTQYSYCCKQVKLPNNEQNFLKNVRIILISNYSLHNKAHDHVGCY